MSKKKSFSGSTMTLKDFHGGSIPSDIPLPSAPGVVVRPADRPSFDRQGSWGNPSGRADHRLRPSSSGSMRSLDDKTPFLTNTANIGRNFDEDERKPLDGLAGTRRMVSDESVSAPPIRPDVRRFMGPQGSAPLSQVHSSGGGGGYSARAPERVPSWGSSGGGQGVSSGSHPNAWGVKKEAVGVVDTVASPYVGQSNVVKFAKASALEKVSSGRWQTKPVHEQADLEVIRQVESPRNLHPRGSDAYHGVESMNERDYSERMLVMHAKKNPTIEESVHNVAKEAPFGERVRSPVLLDSKERVNSGQLPNVDRKYGIPGSQLPAEASERPKLKLLPRTRPLEASESPSLEHKQEQKFQEPNDSSHLENENEVLGNVSHMKPGLGSGDEGGAVVERPKLNLKPRSQPIEQAEESAEKIRMALFGGARPRELVLKGRGVDDVVSNQEVVHSPIRVKNDTPKNETILPKSSAVRHVERASNTNLDHKTVKTANRREQRPDTQKPEVQKNNWRNDNWRNNRDTQKQPLHQQQPERPPSPETWHKPIEQPKPTNADASGVRYGKAASAVELAQAFSRSVSDPKNNAAQFSSPKGVPGRTQVPFSRLTGSTTRPQINGY